jgi:hypothetical protein
LSTATAVLKWLKADDDYSLTIAPLASDIFITVSTTNAQVLDLSWSVMAVFTVSGKPLGNMFLQGNTVHVVPVQQPTVPPPLPAPPPATSSTPKSVQRQEQLQKQQYVFIGKLLKAWGRLVVLLDPKPNQLSRKR